MKQIFNNYEIVLVTEGSWIENQMIKVKMYKCLKANEKGINLVRKVRFDKSAKDLYIKIENKKYFYSEFE